MLLIYSRLLLNSVLWLVCYIESLLLLWNLVVRFLVTLENAVGSVCIVMRRYGGIKRGGELSFCVSIASWLGAIVLLVRLDCTNCGSLSCRAFL